jgi:hypothetical protein
MTAWQTETSTNRRKSMNKAPVQIDLNRFVDWLLAKLACKNDAELARTLEVAPPVISKIRHHRLLVGATLILHLHERFGLNVAEMRAQMEAAQA